TTEKQNAGRTLSAFASAAGQRKSVRRVFMNCGWNWSRGVWQELATLLAKPERAPRQITMLTELGEPFWNVCSSAKRYQVPSRSSRSSAGTHWQRLRDVPGGARRRRQPRAIAVRPLG